MRHVPLERRVGLTTQSGNISMATVLAEEDVTRLYAKHPDTGLRRARRVGQRVLAGPETEAPLSVPQTDAVASEEDGDDVPTQVWDCLR